MVSNTAGNELWYVYLQFNLTGLIPDNAIFLSANLTVRHCSFSAKSGTLFFYEVLNHSWDETTMTWNSGQPDTNSTYFKSIPYSYTVPSNSTYNLTDFIEEEYEEDGMVDMKLWLEQFGNQWIASSENGCLQPELNIRYRNITCGDDICDTEYGESQENCCQDCGCPSGLACVNNKCVVGGMARFWLINIFGTGFTMLLIVFIYNQFMIRERMDWRDAMFRLIGVLILLIVVFYLMVELLVKVFG